MENEKIFNKNGQEEVAIDFSSSSGGDQESEDKEKDSPVDVKQETSVEKENADLSRLTDNLVELLARHNGTEEKEKETPLSTSPYPETSLLSDALLSYSSPASLLSGPSSTSGSNLADDMSKCIPIGDGRVKCLICDRELKRDSWKRHISSVHSNNRPYQCNMCNTTFKLAHDMYKHKRLKHGEEYQTRKRGRVDENDSKVDSSLNSPVNFDMIKT